MAGNGKVGDDVLIDILSKLPLKSLLRFKCVRKSWNSLLKTQSFITKHLIQSDRCGDRNLIIARSGMNNDDDDDTIVFSFFKDKTLTNLAYRDLDIKMAYSIHVDGPCYGIFCLYNQDYNVALWNPVTNEFRILPEYKPKYPPDFKPFSQQVVLGLDLEANDLKVINCVASYQGDNYWYSLAIYSLRSNTWKELEGELAELVCRHRSKVVYTGGVLYWGIGGDFGSGSIVSFQMSNEVFEQMNGPNLGDSEGLFYRGIFLYENSVAWLVSERHDDVEAFQVWVLKEQSWTKQATMELSYDVERPLGFWSDGEFLFEVKIEIDQRGEDYYERRLALYDIVTQRARVLELEGGLLMAEVFIYKGTLLSLNGGNDGEMNRSVAATSAAAVEFLK